MIFKTNNQILILSKRWHEGSCIALKIAQKIGYLKYFIVYLDDEA